ncbi:Hypothetical predicted protein [Cloeon dipterum]|uniref:ATP-dependent DNA helicase n=1 Tax=Cloeon dipterum TaxID=197152 RepID=A0A8S1ECU2_9INSE|nr:Hypothetical predicted protein [Cloeon dipterum]
MRHYMQRRAIPATLHLAGRLSQVFAVYASVKNEEMQLDYYRRNQKKLRFLPRFDLEDALNRQARLQNVTPGRIFIVPDSFKRSPRAFARNLRDQLHIIQTYGTPDLFITCTINRKWPEVIRMKDKFPSMGSDNLDILNRLLHLKLKRLVWLLTERLILGVVKHIVDTIEFQNRGGTHFHMLVTLERKLNTPAAIDEVVKATIPNQQEDPELYALVTDFMLHTRCSPKCARKGVSNCAKEFPVPFAKETEINTGTNVVTYRRPDDGAFFEVNGVKHTNRSVSTYNPFILKFMDSHANVQVVTSVRTVSYILAYIFKGVDKGSMRVMQWRYPGFNPNLPRPLDPSARDMRRREDLHRVNFFLTTRDDRTRQPVNAANRPELRESDLVDGLPMEDVQNVYLEYDEIQAASEVKVVFGADSWWSLEGFEYYSSRIKVKLLLVHEEGKESVRIVDGNIAAALRRDQHDTKLTSFFKIIREFVPGNDGFDARNLYYEQMPVYFRWDAPAHTWRRRVNNMTAATLGRIPVINPRCGDLFYLRMLLKHVPGPRSFTDLKTVNGVTYGTYKEAAKHRSLLRGDDQYVRAMEEVRNLGTTDRLRNFFVTVVMMCELDNPLALMERFAEHMVADWVWRLLATTVLIEYASPGGSIKGMRLADAVSKLQRFMARRLMAAGVLHMPELTEHVDVDTPEDNRFTTPDELRPLGADDPPMSAAEIEADYATLNDEQKKLVDEVVRLHASYIAGERPVTRAVFLSGPAGTGKSRVIAHLDHAIRRAGGRVVKVAPTGMAANAIGGRTAHSAFGLPLNLTDTSSSGMTYDQRRWHTLRRATLVIFDELAMASKHSSMS